MESLPLKELDFGLRKRTGPSSGVVASIVLVSPGLDCPGLRILEIFFLDFYELFKKKSKI